MRPLESNFATNLETINEVFTYLSLYCVLCFSDFVGEPEMRSECGTVLIGIVSAYAVIHVSILLFGTIKSITETLKRRCCHN